MTRNGKPVTMPKIRYASGSSAIAEAVTAPAIAKLIHHDERSRTANSEFSAILHFMRCLASSPRGWTGESGVYDGRRAPPITEPEGASMKSSTTMAYFMPGPSRRRAMNRRILRGFLRNVVKQPSQQK